MIHPLIFTLAATLTACTGPGAPEPSDPNPAEPVTLPETPLAPTGDARALEKTAQLLALARGQDWAALSAELPAEGLRVSGSSLVRLDTDTVLSPAALAAAATDARLYRWGEHPGSGLPWEGTIAALLRDTVAPFDAAALRKVNGRHDTSHSSNLDVVYVGHTWVDLHLPAGGDLPAWQSAVFVLRPEGDKLLWAGLVLDRWIP
jgi:hypothetical protein